MGSQYCYWMLYLFFVAKILATPAPSMLGIEKNSTEFNEGRTLLGDEEEVEDVAEVDPRLVKNYPDFTVGPYECTTHLQCRNEGSCVEAGPIGSVCNCTYSYLGPYCDYSAASIDKALRLHPLFKVNFAECMTKAGETAGINTIAILSKCGSGRNMCWLHEGGVKGLKCFFWCLTNSMHLSLTEAKPSEESRLQLYAEVFQKLARERHLPDTPEGTPPKRVPVASLQINLYETSHSDHPFPKHNTIGISGINISPVWRFLGNPNADEGPPSSDEWPPNTNEETPNADEEPPKGPYDSSDESGREDGPRHPPMPGGEDFQYPKSHELPTPSTDDNEMGPVYENGYSPFYWDPETTDPMGEEDEEDYPPPEITGKDTEREEEAEQGEDELSEDFLNDALHSYMTNPNYNVVEANDDSDDEVMTSPYDPTPDLLSNMRAG